MQTDVYVDVLCFLDRYSLDAAMLAHAAGNGLVNKHLSVYPLRVLKSVVVKSDEGEHRATLIGMDDNRKELIMVNLAAVFRAVFELCAGCVVELFELERIDVPVATMALLGANLANLPTKIVELNNSTGPNRSLDRLIELLHGVETLRLNPPGDVMVTILRQCLEQGIGHLDVRYGAEGITYAGILDFCFGESTNVEDPIWRQLSVWDPGISEDFVERLLQECHDESTSTVRLRIERGKPFDLFTCDEARIRRRRLRRAMAIRGRHTNSMTLR